MLGGNTCKVVAKAVEKATGLQIIAETVGNPLEERFRPFVNGLSDLILELKTDTLQNKIHNLDSVASDADGIIDELTLGRYKSLADLKKAPAGYENLLGARITAKIGAYMSSIDDPDKILSKKPFNNDFANAMRFMYNYKNKANRTLFGFIPMKIYKSASLTKINLLCSNFGKTFKQEPRLYRIFQKMESIGNSMNALTSAYHKHMLQITDDVAKSTGFDQIMPSMHLSKLARFNDPSTRKGMTLEARITKYLGDNDIDVTPDQRVIVDAAVKRFNTEFKILNYGTDTIPAKYLKDDKYFNEDFYKAIGDETNNEFDNKITIDGRSYPPIVRAMAVLGKQLSVLCEEAAVNGVVPPKLEVLNNYFKNLGNKDLGGLQFRTDYMPGKGGDDYVSDLIDHKNHEGLFFDTEILRERTILNNIENDSDNINGVVDVMTSNLKSMRHLYTKAAQISGALAMRRIVNETMPQAKNNETLTDVYTTAKYFSDKIIANDDRVKKQIPAYVITMKRYASATQALMAGLLLTVSGVSNRLNATVTRWLQFGIIDSVKIKNSYGEALAAKGDLGKIARAIDYKFNSFYNQSKISDFLMNRSQTNYDKAHKGVMHLINEQLPELIQRYGERNMTHVLGMFKMGKWNFNDSEGVITDLRKFYMFDLVQKQYAAKGIAGYDSAEAFVDAHFKAMGDEVYLKTKESNGDFSAQAKPFWSHDMLNNAETGRDVLLGLAISIASMFKSVTPVNVDVTQRLMAGIGNSNSINKLSGREYNNTAAFGLLVLALYGIWDKWMDEENDLKILPALNVNPFGEQTDTIAGLSGIINAITNDVTSGRSAKWAVDLLRYPAGVLSSAVKFKERPDNEDKIRKVWDKLEWNIHPVNTVSSLWHSITDGVWNDDAYEFKNSLGRPDFMLLLNDQNKVYKMAKTSLSSMNFIWDGIMENRADFIEKGMDAIGGEMMNILNASWRTHKEPYAGYNYSTQAWKYRSNLRFWSDIQKGFGPTTPLEVVKEAQQRQYASAKLINDMERKFKFSPNVGLLRDIEYMNEQLKRQYNYQQIQEAYELQK